MDGRRNVLACSTGEEELLCAVDGEQPAIADGGSTGGLNGGGGATCPIEHAPLVSYSSSPKTVDRMASGCALRTTYKSRLPSHGHAPPSYPSPTLRLFSYPALSPVYSPTPWRLSVSE